MADKSQSLPPIIKNVAIVHGSVAVLCLIGAFLLIYGNMTATQPPYASGYLIVVLLLFGIFLGIVTNEFYNLRPWAYWTMRFIILVSMKPADIWHWIEDIDASDVRRAFGIKNNK